MLLGTSPGMGYWHYKREETRQLFCWLLRWGSIRQRVLTNSSDINARLHKDGENTYLWVVNPTCANLVAKIELSNELGDLTNVYVYAGSAFAAKGNMLFFDLPAQDAFVARLDFEK